MSNFDCYLHVSSNRPDWYGAKENEPLCGESFSPAPWNMFLTNDFYTTQTVPTTKPTLGGNDSRE